MKKSQTIVAFAFAGLLLAPPSTSAQDRCQDPPSKLLLLRHACRQSCTNQDSPLSRQGQEQAEELIERLGAHRVQEVFVTDKLRTRDTGAPLADVRELDLNELEATGEAAEQLMDDLCSGSQAGRVVLYVGHSDTLDDALRRLDQDHDYQKPACAEGWMVTFNDAGEPDFDALPPSGLMCEEATRSCCSGAT